MIVSVLSAAMKRQRRSTGIAILFALVAAVAGVVLLAVSGWFLTGAALAGLGGMAAVQAFNYLLPSAAIRGLAIARTLSRYGERLFSHQAALFALAEVRPALFKRLAEAEPAQTFSKPPGEVASQLGGDVDSLEDMVVRQVTAPGAMAAACAGLFAASLSGIGSALALLVGLLAMRLASKSMTQRLLPKPAKCHAEALSALKSAYADYAPCAADIAVYGLVPRIEAAMATHARALDEARRDTVRAEVMINGAQLLLCSITVAAVLALAQSGVAMAALGTLAAAGACEAWAVLARSDVQAVRVREALTRLDHLAALLARADQGGELCDLMLEVAGISLAPGERLLITGPSGSGKTRLLGSLVGLRNDAPQALRACGDEVRNLGLNALRNLFAYAPQDASLIAGTVADNLRLARPGVSETEMWAALETACLAETVRALSNGLEQWLGGDGARLSGGQRKRLVLARALLSGKPWLVLDEPSEGLDSATEARLATRLLAWVEQTGTGLILVSHREGLHGLAAKRLDLESA